MFKKNKKIDLLSKNIDKLNDYITQRNITEMFYIMGQKKEIIKRNFLAGISRGVGIGIGVTIITAIIASLLRKIVTLNLPIVGEYITDIVDIVQKNVY